jgi:hypothetical protein
MVSGVPIMPIANHTGHAPSCCTVGYLVGRALAVIVVGL